MGEPMKRALAALALLTALPAHADTLPKSMLGEWCGTDVDTFVRGNCGEQYDRLIVLERNGFGNGDDYGCEFKRVIRLSQGSYFIRASCDGGTQAEELVIQTLGDELEMIPVTRTQDVYYICDPRSAPLAFVNVENNGKHVMVQVRDREARYFRVTRSNADMLTFSHGVFRYPTSTDPRFSMNYAGARYACEPRHASQQPRKVSQTHE